MANKQKVKQQKASQRKKRIRAKIFGTAERPRMNVFRSLQHISVQLIDDAAGKTLVFAKDTELNDKGTKTELATKLGALIAKKATEKGITSVIFDKSSYKYHGRVKALADGAREGGLTF